MRVSQKVILFFFSTGTCIFYNVRKWVTLTFYNLFALIWNANAMLHFIILLGSHTSDFCLTDLDIHQFWSCDPSSTIPFNFNSRVCRLEICVQTTQISISTFFYITVSYIKMKLVLSGSHTYFWTCSHSKVNHCCWEKWDHVSLPHKILGIP